MAKQFDPRKVLKQVSNSLLQQFFTRHSVMGDLAWEDLAETEVEPLFEAWQRMPERRRVEVQLILQDVNELADDRGLRVLAEEVQNAAPDRADEWSALEGQRDKAIWVCLNLPEAFAEAAMFARADALAAGRYWVKRNNLPKQKAVADEGACIALAQALSEYYWPTQLRGQHCLVQHYERANGTDYFFAYLDDYPDRRLIFEDSGQMVPRSQRYAFDNVFAYSPEDGTLETYAHGGVKVTGALQSLFCRTVLDTEVDPDDDAKTVYQLDHLKERSVRLPTDPGDRIAEVRVRSLRLEVVGSPRRRITLDADPRGERGDIYQMIARYLNSERLPLTALRVIHVRIGLTFMAEDGARPKTLTFNVGQNSCDLKSKTDDMRAIGERCLKLWGVTHD